MAARGDLMTYNSRLQSGQGQKTDEAILQGVDGQALGNLTPAPQAICSIGLIMCVSLRQDFPLVEDGKQLPPLLRNKSFRATLVQVSGDAHDAFMTAQGNMHEMALRMDTVPGKMKDIVVTLATSEFSIDQLQRHLTRQLKSLEEIGEDCLAYAEQTHAQFDHVGQVLQNVMELMVAKQGKSQQELEEAKRNKEIQETRLKEIEQMKKACDKEFAQLDKQLKDAQRDMKEVMESKPSGLDLVGAAFADATCALIRDLPAVAQTGIAAYTHMQTNDAMVKSASAVSQAAKSAADKAQAEAQAERARADATTAAEAKAQAQSTGGVAHKVVDAVSAANTAVAPAVDFMAGGIKAVKEAMKTVDGAAKDGNAVAGQLATVAKTVMKFKGLAAAHPLGALAMGVIDIGGGLLEAVKDGQETLKKQEKQPAATDAEKEALKKEVEEMKKKVSEKIEALEKQAQELAVKKAQALATAALPPPQPFTAKIEMASAARDAGPGTGSAMLDSWKFSVENTRASLSTAEQRRDKELSQLRSLEDRMMKENEQLARINTAELSLDQIMDILQSGIRYIGQCQEAWSRLIQLFLFIRSLTRFCCQKQLPDFVNLASDCMGDSKAGDMLVPCLKDQLYQTVVKTSNTAFVAAHLGTTYMEVSREHFLPALAGLGAIYALEEGSPEVAQKQTQLLNQCKRATAAIRLKIEESKTRTQQQIRDRMAQIDDQMKDVLGAPDPKVKALVNKAVEEVKSTPALAGPRVPPVGLDAEDLI